MQSSKYKWISSGQKGVQDERMVWSSEVNGIPYGARFEEWIYRTGHFSDFMGNRDTGSRAGRLHPSAFLNE